MITPEQFHQHIETDPHIIDRHFLFFKWLPDAVKPCELSRTSDLSYRYKYVSGHQPRTQEEVDIVHEYGRKYLWTDVNDSMYLSQLDKQDYFEYVAFRAEKLGWQAFAKWEDTRDILCGSPLKMVSNPHGDFTLENVLINNQGTPVFIDPGMLRRMQCKEIDEAKMLQSIDTKWDLFNGSCDNPFLRAPFIVKPIHYAFLMSHWIRLAMHTERHSAKLINTARQVIGYVHEQMIKLEEAK